MFFDDNFLRKEFFAKGVTSDEPFTKLDADRAGNLECGNGGNCKWGGTQLSRNNKEKIINDGSSLKS